MDDRKRSWIDHPIHELLAFAPRRRKPLVELRDWME